MRRIDPSTSVRRKVTVPTGKDFWRAAVMSG
jgi:hypothetical protein